MEPVQLTRQELYEPFWTEPSSKLAKRYGVSDVALGKTYKRLTPSRSVSESPAGAPVSLSRPSAGAA